MGAGAGTPGYEQERRLRANREARRRIADDGVAVVPPQPVSLADLLTEPDDDGPLYRVGELWPAGGRVLLAAPFKSGKTTLVGNVIRALVDGGEFLGRFATTPVRRVTLIDTELDRRMVRRWLRDQGVTRTDAVTVLQLRGAVSSFDITDPATRAGWARRLAGAEAVILDCLRPVIDALGLSEDKDAGRVLVAFDALLAEAGATEALVVSTTATRTNGHAVTSGCWTGPTRCGTSFAAAPRPTPWPTGPGSCPLSGATWSWPRVS